LGSLSPWVLPASRRQVLFDESKPECIKVRPADSVPAIRVFHEAELLVQVDEFVEQTLCSLEVHVVIARTMNDE
jgi:hypothetical protein